MNSDNPYAAPQSLQPIARTAIVLPMAEERADPARRILFPEISTPVLARIEAASRAIRRMTIVWTIALGLLIIGLCMETLSAGAFGIFWLSMVVGVLVLTFRIFAGVERGPSERYYSLLVDLALCLGLVYLAYRELAPWVQLRDMPPDVPIIIMLMCAVLYLPMTSVLAHVKYFRLFGDERFLHDDLARELQHRRRYRIP